MYPEIGNTPIPHRRRAPPLQWRFPEEVLNDPLGDGGPGRSGSAVTRLGTKVRQQAGGSRQIVHFGRLVPLDDAEELDRTLALARPREQLTDADQDGHDAALRVEARRTS